MDHHHTLQLNDSIAYTCSGCKAIGFGSHYICVSSNCEYILHEECAKPVKLAVHPFFKNCTFEFYEKAPEGGFCDACGEDLLGFFYGSKTGDALHPCCLNLENNISDVLTLSHQVPSDCFRCKKRQVVRDNFEGWSYVVNEKKTCVHVACFKYMILEMLVNTNNNNKSKGRKRSFLKHTGRLALSLLIDLATGDISNSISTISTIIEAVATGLSE